MHVTLNVKHARKDPSLMALLEREATRIVRHLGDVSPDLVSLHGEVEWNSPHREAHASLTLNHPRGALNARSVKGRVTSALKSAADALVTELDRRRNLGRRNLRGKPRAWENGLDHPRELDIAELDRSVRQAMGELRRFVQTELERHRKTRVYGDVPRLDVDDLVDDAVVRALATARECPKDVPFDRWLISSAYDVLVEREEEASLRNPSESLDDEVEVDPSEDDLDASEELVEAPPRTRLVSDLLPSGDDRSEEVPSLERIGEALREALAALPEVQRAALIASHSSEEELLRFARERGLTPARAAEEAAAARQSIRERLRGVGF